VKGLVLFSAAVLISVQAQALTLKEKKQFQEWQDYLKNKSSSYVETVKTKCGFELPVTIDEKMTTPFMAANANAASYCDSVRSVISGMCDDATSKTAIKGAVKKVSCVLGKKADDVVLSLDKKSGVITFSVGVSGSNLDEKVKTYLENNL